jgi:hypothetical protein
VRLLYGGRLLKVGAAVAFTGAASALALIRRRDFVGAAA